MNGNIKDLTGQRFGRLVANYNTGKRKHGKVIWNCICNCGKEVEVLSCLLINKSVQSCGCFKKEKTSERLLKDLTEKRFGKLVAKYKTERKNKHIVWHCICDCGKEIDVLSSYLLSGHTKSCGCYKKETTSKRQSKNLIGKKFGKLTVLYDTKTRNSGRIVWYCICDCGNKSEATSNHLLRGLTQSCGCQKESYVSSELKQFYIKNYDAKTEYNILKNPKTGCYLPYDIYIPNGKNLKINGIYIEVNGKQHYSKNNFHKMIAKRNSTTLEQEFKYQKYKDKLKKNFAKANGIYIEIDLRKIKTTKEAIVYIENKNQLIKVNK